MHRRLLSVLALVTAFTVGSAAPAFAAEVDEVADAVSTQGFFVERGASASGDDISRIVSDVRSDGENLSIVVLSDEPGGGATTFADAVVNQLLGDTGTAGLILVVAPETIGYAGVSEVYSEGEIEAALDEAITAGGDDAAIARSFASALVGVLVGSGGPTATVSPATTTAQSSSSNDSTSGSGGGGGGFLLFLLLIGGGLLVFFWWRSRKKKKQQQPQADSAQLSKARQAVQNQLDAVANDILDMEDEVRLADNARADRYYQEAAQTYRAATDAFPKAQSPAQLLELSNQLDVAIWQLDSAEAVLDGNPVPERPAPRRLEPRRREPVGAPGRSGGTVPRPEYQRRPSRRSSYGGPSMMDLLIMVGGAVMSGRRRGGGLFGRSSRSAPASSGRGGLGGLFGRSSRQAPPPRDSRESGSSPVPSPSRRGTSSRSSSRSARPKSSRSGSGGKRIRGGRRRRR